MDQKNPKLIADKTIRQILEEIADPKQVDKFLREVQEFIDKGLRGPELNKRIVNSAMENLGMKQTEPFLPVVLAAVLVV